MLTKAAYIHSKTVIFWIYIIYYMKYTFFVYFLVGNVKKNTQHTSPPARRLLLRCQVTQGIQVTYLYASYRRIKIAGEQVRSH